MSRFIDLTGLRFGRIKVLSRSDEKRATHVLWNCVCDCGGVSLVISQHLRTGHTKSCGCQKNSGLPNFKHGHSGAKTRTYRTWKEMRQRCANPNSDKWKWYGGRGITVCSRWDLFENFLADMGERPVGKSIDRVDNDGNYEPSNCAWATQAEQVRKQKHTKLNVDLVIQLRQDSANGMPYRRLGVKYGISATTATRCAVGVSWKGIGGLRTAERIKGVIPPGK